MGAHEAAKVEKSAALCSRAGMAFAPLGLHTWGGLGPAGTVIMDRVGKLFTRGLCASVRGTRVGEFRVRVSFALMGQVARQLSMFTRVADGLPALDAFPEGFEDPRTGVDRLAEVDLEEVVIPIDVEPGA